jgi:hypothetical protein
MVTRDQLWHQLGKRPFQPFRLTLIDGETIEIFRPNQALVTPRQVIAAVGPDEEMTWIPLERVDRMEVTELGKAAP